MKRARIRFPPRKVSKPPFGGLGAHVLCPISGSWTHACHDERSHSDEIVSRVRESEHPVDAWQTLVPQLREQAYGFAPPNRLFDSLAFALTDLVAGMACGSFIDRTRMTARVHIRTHMRLKAQLANGRDEVATIVTLVRAHRRLAFRFKPLNSSRAASHSA